MIRNKIVPLALLLLALLLITALMFSAASNENVTSDPCQQAGLGHEETTVSIPGQSVFICVDDGGNITTLPKD